MTNHRVPIIGVDNGTKTYGILIYYVYSVHPGTLILVVSCTLSLCLRSPQIVASAIKINYYGITNWIMAIRVQIVLIFY